MTYQKPDMKYTTMAIWVDEHAYTDKYDAETLYQYLYHLSLMIAYQNSYFDCATDYDDFGLYSASRLFLRLTNPKQFETPSRLEQIKSILNYIKKTSYNFKIDFMKEFRTSETEVDVIPAGNFDFSDFLVDNSSLFDVISYSFGSSVSDTIAQHLLKIPRKKNSAEWINIYISCLLTLLDSITLPEWIHRRYNVSSDTRFDTIVRLYQSEREKDPILFHLPVTMKGYIKVLTNQLRHVIASEMSREERDYVSSNDAMSRLFYSSLKKDSENEYKE